MQEELITSVDGITVPPDEIIKLQCIDFASRKTQGSFILDVAKEMYNWVKEKPKPE